MTLIQWYPVVHSHITLLTQDAEQIVKAFLSLDFAKPEPSLKVALEQAILLHLVSCLPVICGEWHIERGLTEDRCGSIDTNEVAGSEAMFQSHMVRSGKTGGGYKNGCNSKTIGLIDFKLGQSIDGSVPYYQMALFLC